jgi:hypothetical protein
MLMILMALQYGKVVELDSEYINLLTSTHRYVA